MPEGPEIHMASKFINRVCANRLFTGKPVKSDVNKNIDIPWNATSYRILSKSRGKELMLTLTADVDSTETMDILFHFGMSGVFKFTTVNQIPKHAHLKFHTLEEKPAMALSFVDARRFGSWRISNAWSPDRGPDPVFEYEQFRENILTKLKDTAFNKALCEVLLNQSYFNGIGNYLRAEILYRAKISPFEEARTVLEALCTVVKHEGPDLLQLCQSVPLEVINLGGTNIYDPDATEEDLKPFMTWIQCYNNTSMKKMQDHNKRTSWFHGQPGPLAPKKNERSRNARKRKAVKKEKEDRMLENVGDEKKVKKEAHVHSNEEDSKTKSKRKVKKEMAIPAYSEEQTGLKSNKRKVKNDAGMSSTGSSDAPLLIRFTRSRTKFTLPQKN